MKSIEAMSQPEVNRYCRAASAAYFAIIAAHSQRTGTPVTLPQHLCPTDDLPCLCDYSDEELSEAEDFLVRLGMIGRA
ncbi:MAG: hypothetical protein AAF747_05630 [Planctomycetota bacterium]